MGAMGDLITLTDQPDSPLQIFTNLDLDLMVEYALHFYAIREETRYFRIATYEGLLMMMLMMHPLTLRLGPRLRLPELQHQLRLLRGRDTLGLDLVDSCDAHAELVRQRHPVLAEEVADVFQPVNKRKVWVRFGGELRRFLLFLFIDLESCSGVMN